MAGQVFAFAGGIARQRYAAPHRIARMTGAQLPLDRMWPLDPDNPINPARGEARGEHLDQIEAALRSGA
jgi:hypothetical protein